MFMIKRIGTCLAITLCFGSILVGCGNKNSASTHTNNTNPVEDVIAEQTGTITDQVSGNEIATLSLNDLESVAKTDVDIDLTEMSNDMVYASCYNITAQPSQYIGKTVRMRGTVSYYTDSQTNKTYATVVVTDSTGCCTQGIEFELSGDLTCPEGYPAAGTEVTISGTLETYEEGGYTYLHAANAVVEG